MLLTHKNQEPNFFVVLMPQEKIIAATIEYTSQRKAFGKSILDNQVVHYRYCMIHLYQLTRMSSHKSTVEMNF